MADLSEVDDGTLNTVDTALHKAKAAHSSPIGNPVFRLLCELAQPVCDEVERRDKRKGKS